MFIVFYLRYVLRIHGMFVHNFNVLYDTEEIPKNNNNTEQNWSNIMTTCVLCITHTNCICESNLLFVYYMHVLTCRVSHKLIFVFFFILIYLIDMILCYYDIRLKHVCQVFMNLLNKSIFGWIIDNLLTDITHDGEVC